MAEDEIKEIPEELRKIGLKAIAFQRFILRRTWGIYYALWALFFSLIFFVDNINSYFSIENYYFVYFIEYTLATILASFAMWNFFNKAYKLLELKGILIETNTRRNYRRVYQIFSIAYFIVLVSLLYFEFSFVILYISLLIVPIIGLISQKQSLDRITFEGALSFFSFTIACILSIVVSLYGNYPLISAIWLIESLIWAFSGFYAIYKAPDELEWME